MTETTDAVAFWDNPNTILAAGDALDDELVDRFTLLDDCGRAAVIYAALYGFAVFPLKPRDKSPLSAGWQNSATTDPTQVLAMFEQAPGANVGAAMGAPSGVDLIDFDIDDGTNGLYEFNLKGLCLPKTLTARTGRGGHHYYYNHTPGLKNQNGWLPGCDFKTTGGLVVLPPSIHPNGKAYEWDGKPGDVAPVSAPDWLADHIPAKAPEARTNGMAAPPALDLRPPSDSSDSDGTAAYVAQAIEAELDNVRNGREGARNQALNESAFNLGQLAPRYADENELLARLVDAAVSNGLPEVEARKTAVSGLNAGARKPREIEPARSAGLGELFSGLNGAPSESSETPTPSSADIDAKLASAPQTDLGNAERIVAVYGRDIRLVCSDVPGSNPRALVWDDRVGRWQYDGGGILRRMAANVARRTHEIGKTQLRAAAGDKDGEKVAETLQKFARRSEGESRLSAAANLVPINAALEIHEDSVDARPMLLNVGNGTLDLERRELRAADRRDLMTSGTPVKFDPAAPAPVWEAALWAMFGGRADVIAFIQEFAGVCLTGIVGGRAKAIPIFYGPSGNNGKSTLIDALFGVLGPYATETSASLFYAKPAHAQGGPSNDLAALVGRRLATAVETSTGARLDEALLKKISGGDKVTARFLRQEFFSFKPQAKIILVTNHLPRVDACSPAMWTRLRLIPFEVEFGAEGGPALDETIPAQLKKERSGILNWALDGLDRWRAHGFTVSPTVADATSEFRDSENWLEEFLEQYTFTGPDQRVDQRHLWRAFKISEDGRPRIRRAQFNEAIGGLFSTKKSNGVRYYVGLDLNERGIQMINPNKLPDWQKN